MILVEVVRNRKTNLLSNKMLSELRSKIFSKLLSLKMKDFEKFPSSDIYTRLTVDAENVKTLFSEDIPVIVNDIMNIIFMLVAMFIINVKLAFIGTAIIIVFVVNLSIICFRKYGAITFKIFTRINKITIIIIVFLFFFTILVNSITCHFILVHFLIKIISC